MLINGCWENRSDSRLICRWFIACSVQPDGGMIGSVAGYSGHGVFEVERFRLWASGDQVQQLWIDNTDRISGVEIDLDSLPEGELQIAEDSLDAIWEWHDKAIWEESDNLVLLHQQLSKLVPQKELFTYHNFEHPFLSIICEKAGLTASPLTSKNK